MKLNSVTFLALLFQLADATIPKDMGGPQLPAGAIDQTSPAHSLKRSTIPQTGSGTPLEPLARRDLLDKRATTCPGGMIKVTCPTKEGCCPIGNHCFVATTGELGCCADGTICTTVSGCATGSFQCPASLGGGCCTDGTTCSADNGGTCNVGSSSTFSSTGTDTSCAAGKYRCAVTDGGGCCPTGTTCSLSNGGTCLSSTNTCATGKFLCAPELGGGCCDNGTTCSLANGGTCIPGSSCAAGKYLCSAAVGGGCCPNGTVCGPSSCLNPASTTSADTPTPTSKSTTFSIVDVPTGTTTNPPSLTTTHPITTIPLTRNSGAEMAAGAWGMCAVAVMGIAAAVV